MDAADIQKRKDRTITLSIETKVREFPGKVLLSCFLAEKGFRVILTNDRKYDKVIDENSWLFIDRNTFASRKSFFKNLRRSNIDIACLDEEGIVWANPLIQLMVLL
jgi:surface carbohydrate biosynthesis protein